MLPRRPDAADSLRLLLELYGYEVTVAYSGPEGVKAAEEWKPDVVLCDIGLPGLDGYGVVGRLRRNPSTAKARMIAVTGYGGDDDKRRTQEAGFDRNMVKPVAPKTSSVSWPLSSSGSASHSRSHRGPHPECSVGHRGRAVYASWPAIPGLLPCEAASRQYFSRLR